MEELDVDEPQDDIFTPSATSRVLAWIHKNYKRLLITIAALLIIAVATVGCIIFLSYAEEEVDPGDSNNTKVSPDLANYTQIAESIIQRARNTSQPMYDHLAQFTDDYPARICGSANLEAGLQWLKGEWEKENFDNVTLQPVSGVPNWKRNEASLQLIEPRAANLSLLALGNSIGTPEEGLEGEVFVVSSFDELNQKQNQAVGKIVLFNAVFTHYGETVTYRVNGAYHAAAAGAIGCLVRSITPYSLQTPHTGVMRYQDNTTKIPTAAITLETADYFQRLQDRSETIRVRWFMNCVSQTPLADSYNLIAEVRGSENPEEIILLGGHVDSWDVGNGAMDDGGGVFAAYYALKTIVSLDLKPKRTIRIIAWVDEENSGRGADAYYASLSQEEINNHVLAYESDSGVSTPVGFSFTSDATPGQIDLLSRIVLELMSPLGYGNMTTTEEGGGADTEILHEEGGVPVSELLVDTSHYFWYHHTAADTIDKIDKNSMADCSAGMSILAFVISDYELSFNKLP